MVPKCARLLSGAPPSATSGARRPAPREGRQGAVARGWKTLRPVLVSTGLVSGIVPALCSVVRLNVSPSAPLGFYRQRRGARAASSARATAPAARSPSSRALAPWLAT